MNRQDYPRDNRYAQGGAQPRQAYRRQTPHISQEPINDLDSDYVTVDRFDRGARREAPATGRGHRRHMGVASPDDVDYLNDTMPGDQGRSYAKYLQTPKPGKSIFTARRERRRHTAFVVAAVAIAIVVVAIILTIVF